MLFLCKCNLFFYTTFHLKPGWTRLLPVFCFLPKTWRLRQTKKTPPEFCSAILNFLKVQEFFSRPDERAFSREIIPRSQLKWRTNRYCCYGCFAKRSDPHCNSSVARSVRRKTTVPSDKRETPLVAQDQLYFFSFKRHNSDSACIKQSSSSAVWKYPDASAIVLTFVNHILPPQNYSNSDTTKPVRYILTWIAVSSTITLERHQSPLFFFGFYKLPSNCRFPSLVFESKITLGGKVRFRARFC